MVPPNGQFVNLSLNFVVKSLEKKGRKIPIYTLCWIKNVRDRRQWVWQPADVLTDGGIRKSAISSSDIDTFMIDVPGRER